MESVNNPSRAFLINSKSDSTAEVIIMSNNYKAKTCPEFDVNMDEIDFDKEAESLGEDFVKNDLNHSKMYRNVYVNNKMPFPVTKNEAKGNKTYNYNSGKNAKQLSFTKSPFTPSNAMHRQEYEGIKVQENQHSVLIRNMPRILTERMVREIFSEFGYVHNINMERDTAEVYYFRKEEAVKAAHVINGKEIFGKYIQVTFKDKGDCNYNTIMSLSKSME